MSSLLPTRLAMSPLLSLVLLLSLLCNPLHAGSTVGDESESASSSVVDLTDESFEQLTQAATGATTGDWLVEFYAPWEEVADELRGSINVARLDVTTQPATAQRFEVSSLPHIVYLSRGRLFDHSGGRDKADLVHFARDRQHRLMPHAQHPTGDADDESSPSQPESSADTSSESAASASGRPVPPPLTAWKVFRNSALTWAGQLQHTLTTLPAVSAALVSVGVMLGVLLTVVAFALMLPNEAKPAGAANGPIQTDGARKVRKAD